jgi:hypothetical protein
MQERLTSRIWRTNSMRRSAIRWLADLAEERGGWRARRAPEGAVWPGKVSEIGVAHLKRAQM